jgi:hypothetical protein
MVLGAGASMHLKFPSGAELVARICEQLGNSGSETTKTLRACEWEDTIEMFRRELSASQQPSVDAFLENRPEYLEIGKLAIASSLIPFEMPDRISNRVAKDDWYQYLFSHLGLTPDNYQDSKLTFVTFNYDRSLSYFLFTAMKHSFGLSDKEAATIVRALEPIHVYGKLGELRELHDQGRGYSQHVTPKMAKIAADSMRIMVDGVASGELEEAWRAIDEAELIMFIGFGYHKVYVWRLMIPDRAGRRQLCGSAYGLGAGERVGVASLFPNAITLGDPGWDALKYLKESPFLSWAKGADIPATLT